MRKIFYIFLFSISVVTLNAQIQTTTTTNYNNPSYLIDNILIGNGIVSSNHSFIGDSAQIGFFTDSAALVGMDSGIVLSTGRVDSIGNLGVTDTLWNYIWDSTWTNIIDSTPIYQTAFLSTAFFGNNDPDLLTIANSVPNLIGQTFSVSSTGDAAILEFDFIPSSDTLRFNYVFASEEYLTFVNSSYNDVFAFLISGPGISGPYAAPAGFPNGAMNIAEVPNSNPSLPITISTINDVLNSQYYNHDSTASVSAFNGYTDMFTAEVVVIPCEKYHIKLAIADGSDEGYDSAVLLDAGSFETFRPGPPNIQVMTTDALCHGDTTGTAIACVQGGIAPYSINWNGNNPNGLSAGSYTVIVTDAAGFSTTTNFIISEPNPISIVITQPIFDLEAIISGGTPSYTYEWIYNGLTVGNSSILTPIQNGNYSIIITDINGCVVSANYTVINVPSSIEESSKEKTLINIKDILGRRVKGKTNEPLFYIYDDGTVEKRITIE